MAKRAFTVEKTSRLSGTTATIALPIVKFDGGSKPFVREFDCSKLDPDLLAMILRAGVDHTLGDMMALPAGENSPAEKFAAVDARWAAWLDGEWARARKAPTAEERAARLEARVGAAWAEFKGEDSSKFAEVVGAMLRKNQEKNPAITRGDVVAAIGRVPAIREILDRAATTVEVEVDEM